MDVPFEKGETKYTQEEEIYQIVRASRLAMYEHEQRIDDQNFDGIEGAIQLLGSYFCYAVQNEISLVDVLSFPKDNEQAATVKSLVSEDILYDKSIPFDATKIKEAIRDAQQGNYKNLVEAAKDLASNVNKFAATITTAEAEPFHKFEDGLRALLAVMPTHGSYLLRLPIPAQLDERYNGELDKYSDK